MFQAFHVCPFSSNLFNLFMNNSQHRQNLRKLLSIILFSAGYEENVSGMGAWNVYPYAVFTGLVSRYMIHLQYIAWIERHKIINTVKVLVREEDE